MTGHPMCGHDRYHGDDMWDVECCICGGNPCSAVTVELMMRHREFDIDLWTRPATVGGGDEPPF